MFLRITPAGIFAARVLLSSWSRLLRALGLVLFMILRPISIMRS
jgi:hypothetical protein